MSHSTYGAAAPRRRRWLLLVPVALVLALAVAWTGLWFYAAARAKSEMVAWREREAQAGRVQECASQSITGFPFRIEVRCGGAGFELEGSPTITLRLPFVLVAVQIYDPSFLISEFKGPVELAERGRPTSYIGDWSLGQASVRGLPSRVERASLVLDRPSVRDLHRAGNDTTVFTAQRLEMHGRQAPGSTLEHPALETVLHLSGAVAEKIHPAAAKPIDAEIATVLHGPNDIKPKPWPVRFKEWQARGGRIDIVKARLVQDDIIAVGAGTLKLTSRGGLDGNFQVTVVGMEKVLKLFDIERIMSEGQIGASLSALDRLIPGLGGIARQSAVPGLVAALGQRATLEGRPAVAFPLRFSDGAVFLGPFQVGQVPPLF
jgi:hypothetical protein